MTTAASLLERPLRLTLPWGFWVIGFATACICGAASFVALGVTILFADSPNVDWSRVWLSLSLRCLHFGLLVAASLWGHYRRLGPAIILALIVSIYAMFHWPDELLVTPLELLPLAFFVLASLLRIMRAKAPNQSSAPSLSSGRSAAGQPPPLP
jgi:hypothetical protein